MATWTAATAIPSGGLITSGWVTAVTSGINMLGAATNAGGNKDLFYARQGTTQTVGTSQTVITFMNEDIDTAGGHDLTANQSRYVIQSAGKYRLAGGIATPALGTAVNDVNIGIVKNSVSAISGSTDVQRSSNIIELVNTPIVYASLNVGDYVELYGYATNSFSTYVSGPQSWFAVEWIAS